MMTGAEMLFDLGHEGGVDLSIEVVGEFGEKVRAVH
jgi:hypothetical protein